MKVVISGARGFIGSHLMAALLSKGFLVERISQEILYSPKDLNKFFTDYQPDYIFHLGAYGNMGNQTDPSMIVFSNIIGTFNMLKESVEIPYKGFINFGSSSEYGISEDAMSENDRLLPETFYGASKAGATHLAYVFARQFNKPIVTVRPFSVYGPGEAVFRFIPTAIKNMITKNSFPLDAKANHDWIFIDDFIKGVLLVMDKVQQFSNIGTKTVNIGSGRMHSNKEVCEMLKKISGFHYYAFPYEKLRPRDSAIWLSDNTLIKGFGFHTDFMLEDGLKVTYDYYSKLYDSQSIAQKKNN